MPSAADAGKGTGIGHRRAPLSPPVGHALRAGKLPSPAGKPALVGPAVTSSSQPHAADKQPLLRFFVWQDDLAAPRKERTMLVQQTRTQQSDWILCGATFLLPLPTPRLLQATTLSDLPMPGLQMTMAKG